MASGPAIGRNAFRDGIVAMTPLMIGVIPFGLIFGVTVTTVEVNNLLGYATSIIIFAGAAQFATIDLMNQGAAAVVVIATALVINSRHFMYSAALAPHFTEFPRKWQGLGPYLLTDQAFAISITRYETATDPFYKRWFYLGAAFTLWAVWQTTTGAGVLLGTTIPESWNLEFAVPLVFLALLIPTVKNMPAFAAAVVAGVVSVVGVNIPLRLGIIVAALSGIAAGVLIEPWIHR